MRTHSPTLRVNIDELDELQQELNDSVAELLTKVPLHISCTQVQEQLAHWAQQVRPAHTMHMCTFLFPAHTLFRYFDTYLCVTSTEICYFRFGN